MVATILNASLKACVRAPFKQSESVPGLVTAQADQPVHTSESESSLTTLELAATSTHAEQRTQSAQNEGQIQDILIIQRLAFGPTF